MKNKALRLFNRTISYIKELRQITGSVHASILMQQLDFWFDRYPEGFYKFLEPAQNNTAYNDGDSWTEELAFSRKEFNSAFDCIGIRYDSKSEYDKAVDKFKDKEGKEYLYCSYRDRLKGTTRYLRNHKLVDYLLDLLVEGDTEKLNAALGNIPKGRYVVAHKEVTQHPEGALMINTESTTESTTETITSSPVKPDSDVKDSKTLNAVNQTFPEKLDDLVHQISQIASKINFYKLNTYRDYFRNHGKQIFKQLALRVSRQEISKEDLSAVFSEMGKPSDFSVLQFLLELVNRSEKYTEHTAMVDFISIFSDGMVSNFPAEASAISKLRKWVKEGKFTLLDIEDCFLWMQFCSGRNYDVTLTTVPKAMSGFLQKRKQMPNGRYTVEGFNYYKTKEEKTVEILRNRDYDDDTILEKEKAYKDLVKSLTGK